MALKAGQTITKKQDKVLSRGHLYVTATFNNTIATITDEKGNAVCWGSTGISGFKGSRKSTPFAATTTVDKVVQQAKGYGLKEVRLFIKGPGVGRDASLRVLRSSGIKLLEIADMTPIPHNGCRARKRRKG